MKTAFITGVTGQDGALLTKFLLDKDYRVIGLRRRASSPNLWRLTELGVLNNKNFILVYGDLSDYASITGILKQYRPDEVYNLAAQSYVGSSWTTPLSTIDITGVGAVRLFDAVQKCCRDAKIYQASSSEMYGGRGSVITENFTLYPRSPYAAAKVLAHNIADIYRKSYNMFISCGILFNHESPYRGIEFVTRKISYCVARIHFDQISKIDLGNIAAQRDWGHAEDYVEAMWLMLQQDKPDDFIIATGKSHSVEYFCQKAFEAIGVVNYKQHIRQNKNLIRPNEVNVLKGDYSKAYNILKWKPKKTFDDLVKEMVDADIERLK